jgi:plastocyanin
MKFSTIPTLGALFAVASASLHTQEVDVVCTDANPTTVTQTVTVTAPPHGGNTYVPANARGNPSPYVTTYGGSVTSVDYSGSTTSVWVYPTGSPSHDCTVAIYENDTVNVIIININVQIVNGATTTITSTKTDVKPTWVPQLPYSTTSTSSSYSAKKTHNVIVGADGELKYAGNNIDAAIGDIIRFDFNSTNHTVTESTFDKPCSPKDGGFNTGFNQFNNQNHTGIIFREFEVKVNTPLWFYCAQTVKVSHCQKGMVLGINAAGKVPEFLARATATATSTSSTAYGTGKVSTPAAYTPVAKTLSTGGSSMSTTTTSSSTHKAAVATPSIHAIKGRRVAAWSA